MGMSAGSESEGPAEKRFQLQTLVELSKLLIMNEQIIA